MKTSVPTAENIAKLLLVARLSERERLQIIRSLDHLPERQIIKLYEALQVLVKKEKKIFKALLKKLKN